MVWPQVIKEPIVKEGDPAMNDPGIRGVWQPQVEVLFDIQVVDTNAPSYRQCTPAAVLDSGAVERRVYHSAVEDRRGNFTLFVQSVDGLLQREASLY